MNLFIEKDVNFSLKNNVFSFLEIHFIRNDGSLLIDKMTGASISVC